MCVWILWMAAQVIVGLLPTPVSLRLLANIHSLEPVVSAYICINEPSIRVKVEKANVNHLSDLLESCSFSNSDLSATDSLLDQGHSGCRTVEQFTENLNPFLVFRIIWSSGIKPLMNDS